MVENLSRDERVSLAAIVATTTAIAWYRSELTGWQRLTSLGLVALVSFLTATATLAVLNHWNPGWYRS